MSKIGEEIIFSFFNEIEQISSKYVGQILDICDKKSRDPYSWPVAVKIGTPDGYDYVCIKEDDRIINRVIEKLSDEGFMVSLSKHDFISVDLPRTMPKISTLSSASVMSELAKNTINDKVKKIDTYMADIILAAAKDGKKNTNIKTDCELIKGDVVMIKYCINKLSNLGYKVSDGLQKDKSGNIKYEEIKNIKVNW